MTIRNKYADIFWFSLLHEIAHVINGDFEDRLIDFNFAKGEKEEEADRYACDRLVNPDYYLDFINKGDFSLNAISLLARANHVPNYIVIGRLQHDGVIPHSRYNQERMRYVWAKD
jgi:HTH-type transcriptional regulator/antitoxin HigA